jgi:hypothetical protein
MSFDLLSAWRGSSQAPLRFPRIQMFTRRSQPRVLAAFLILAFPAAGQVNVTMQHNDRLRSGTNLAERTLTPANVNSKTFGKKFVHAVDGYVYAQPLYLSQISIPNLGTHNVVYVVTEHDSAYAFDADNNSGANSAPLWQTSFIDPAHGITPVSSSDTGCGDLAPEIGITGTPVIDPVAHTIYFVAKTKENGVFVQRLHALDVSTGSERANSPVVIRATVSGGGDGSVNGQVSFDALTESQRAGLLLMNGVIYIGWASHCDNGPYHGWLLGYDKQTLNQVAVFNSTPNGGLGGFWASGSGIAGDSAAGAIFAVTGNGTFDADQSGLDYGETILRLDRSSGRFAVSDSFTPFNQRTLNNGDTDLGSGGVLLLPNGPANAPHAQLLLQSGKQGSLYLVDRNAMGHFNSKNNNQIVQFIPFAVGNMFSMPAWWNNCAYFGGSGDNLRVFKFDPQSRTLAGTPSSKSTTFFGFPGATPSISANGNTNAIVWALQTDAFASNGAAILHAYDALDLSRELYRSNQNPSRDGLTTAVKFAVPTIANGKVYVGTRKQLTVFGLLP